MCYYLLQQNGHLYFSCLPLAKGNKMQAQIQCVGK